MSLVASAEAASQGIRALTAAVRRVGESAQAAAVTLQRHRALAFSPESLLGEGDGFFPGSRLPFSEGPARIAAGRGVLSEADFATTTLYAAWAKALEENRDPRSLFFGLTPYQAYMLTTAMGGR